MKKQVKDFIILIVVFSLFLSLIFGINLCLEDLNKQSQNQVYVESTEPTIEEITLPTFATDATEIPNETVGELIITPIFVPITEEWFDNTLFIGDSRTLGMKEVKRLGKADYFAQNGMSVFTAQGWRATDSRFFGILLREALAMYDYDRVFIELGINECGYELEDIIKSYQSFIDLIYEYEPDTLIIIQAVISVSKNRAQWEVFSLERIEGLNKELEVLAEKNKAIYINPNEFLADEEGYLYDNLTTDGCHLNQDGNLQWVEFILRESEKIKNGIIFVEENE